jgi:lysozyme
MNKLNKASMVGGGAIIAIAAAVQIATPLAEQFEGLRTRAYRDPVNILTVCYGETEAVDPARIYSRDDCAAKLRRRMAQDYAPKLLDCVPGFIDPARKQQFGAALDASYNAGPAAFCRSPMAAAFNAGRWRAGCDAFAGWYVTGRMARPHARYPSRRLANGQWAVTFPGLVRRRAAEREICLREAS